MNPVTLCMLVNAPFRYVRSALRGAIHYLRPAEVILSPSPTAAKHEHVERLREFIPRQTRVVVLGGTGHRERMAWFRFAQFDAATQPWIANLDDDDGVCGEIDWSAVPADAGLIHTDILGLCLEKSSYLQPGDVQLRDSKAMIAPEMASQFKGSFWCIRRDAWLMIKNRVDRTALYEDWGCAYHALLGGWKDYYIPRVLQYQRLRDFVAAAEAQQASGYHWGVELASLQRKFEAPGGRGRYWQQEWDRRQDPAELWWIDRQGSRMPLYDVLPQQPCDVIDVGCGGCADYAWLQERGFRYTGVDIFTDQSRDFAFREDPRVIEGDVLDGLPAAADLVIANDLLNHLPGSVIQRALRSLWNATRRTLVIRVSGVDVFARQREIMARHHLYLHRPMGGWIDDFRQLGGRLSTFPDGHNLIAVVKKD